VQASNGQVSDGSTPAAGSGTAEAGLLLVDVVSDGSTAAGRSAAQPVADIDAAGAIPEDNFTQYVIPSLNFCC